MQKLNAISTSCLTIIMGQWNFPFCVSQEYFCRLIDDDGFILATNQNDDEVWIHRYPLSCWHLPQKSRYPPHTWRKNRYTSIAWHIYFTGLLITSHLLIHFVQQIGKFFGVLEGAVLKKFINESLFEEWVALYLFIASPTNVIYSYCIQIWWRILLPRTLFRKKSWLFWIFLIRK